MTVKKVSLRITPDPSLHVAEESKIPHIKITQSKPFAMIGAARVPTIATTSVQPDEQTCFGPRGGALMSEDGPFWICDTGHHRLLGWDKMPKDDDTPADWIIGQPTMNHEGRNAKGNVTAFSVNVPTGICSYQWQDHSGDKQIGMIVADAWNHRVLVWNNLPQSNNVPADLVLGQVDFNRGESNRGTQTADAGNMHWPYGVAWEDGHLIVADAENRRLLIWKGMPTSNGQPADTVLGQKNFECRDENAGGVPSKMSMRWPHGLAYWKDHLCVSDAGNNRIMVWKGIPETNGADCDYILGQKDEILVDHNQSLYWPRANTLNMPYGIASFRDWLIVADTANSRLLSWHIDDLKNNAHARGLCGQDNFHVKGDNRWLPAVADSVCWPYGIQIENDILTVADSGNNRVSLWKLIP